MQTVLGVERREGWKDLEKLQRRPAISWGRFGRAESLLFRHHYELFRSGEQKKVEIPGLISLENSITYIKIRSDSGRSASMFLRQKFAKSDWISPSPLSTGASVNGKPGNADSFSCQLHSCQLASSVFIYFQM